MIRTLAAALGLLIALVLGADAVNDAAHGCPHAGPPLFGARCAGQPSPPSNLHRRQETPR